MHAESDRRSTQEQSYTETDTKERVPIKQHEWWQGDDSNARRGKRATGDTSTFKGNQFKPIESLINYAHALSTSRGNAYFN